MYTTKIKITQAVWKNGKSCGVKTKLDQKSSSQLGFGHS